MASSLTASTGSSPSPQLEDSVIHVQSSASSSSSSSASSIPSNGLNSVYYTFFSRKYVEEFRMKQIEKHHSKHTKIEDILLPKPKAVPTQFIAPNGSVYLGLPRLRKPEDDPKLHQRNSGSDSSEDPEAQGNEDNDDEDPSAASASADDVFVMPQGPFVLFREPLAGGSRDLSYILLLKIFFFLFVLADTVCLLLMQFGSGKLPIEGLDLRVPDASSTVVFFVMISANVLGLFGVQFRKARFIGLYMITVVVYLMISLLRLTDHLSTSRLFLDCLALYLASRIRSKLLYSWFVTAS